MERREHPFSPSRVTASGSMCNRTHVSAGHVVKRFVLVWAAVCVSVSLAGRAGEPVDLQIISRIKAEGIRNSRVMRTLSDLTERHGPRLSGSPGLKDEGA